MARKKGPQAQRAYEYIKDQIQNFELVPGSAVSDHALEQELSMSRSPIREAMQRLSAEGLLEFTGQGARVTGITLEDIVEICQVRRAVEVACVQVLMENGGLSTDQKERLTLCFQKLQSAQGPVDGYFYDDQFHDLIAGFSGNRRLLEISHQMRAQIYRARWLNCILPHRLREAEEEHAAIYRALMAGDREKSVAAMEAHLDQSEDNFRSILSGAGYAAQMAAIPQIVRTSRGGARD